MASAILAASCGQPPAQRGEAPEQKGPAESGGQAARGTIRGHVRVLSTPPPNATIRLRADPMCERASGGKPGLQETVLAGPDGSLANVFVKLEGAFPGVPPPPPEPVIVDQRACIYTPRVVGLQIGQPLRVINSDPGLHNVHGVSPTSGFNIAQPVAGMVNEFQLKDEGVLRLQCDVHTWMLAFVGVVAHPYFAVTGRDGTFEIRNVPSGNHSVQAWHELYGTLTSTTTIAGASIGNVDFAYPGEEKPAARPATN
jgi:hypothetical protein